jgi:hypothetical protein
MKWTPSFYRRPDGSYYEAAIFTTGGAWNHTSAYINEPDGTQLLVRSADPRMRYDTHTRFVQSGELHLVMDSGEERGFRILLEDCRLRLLEGAHPRFMDGTAASRRRVHR